MVLGDYGQTETGIAAITDNFLIWSNDFPPQIKDLNAKLVICTSDTSDKVQEATQLSKERVPGVQALSFGPAVGCLDLVDALKTCVLDSEKPERAVQYNGDELKEKTCLVFWSSGTTGLPKGMIQSI